MKKKKNQAIAAVITIMFIVYLFTAFLLLQPNPLLWGDSARGLSAIAVILLSGIAVFGIYDSL